MRADGTFTPYCAGPCLARELGRPSIPGVGAGAEVTGIQKAIDDLGSKAGLRLLLVDTPNGAHRTVPAWANQAAGRLDVVYAIDGGEELKIPDCEQAPAGTGFPIGGPLCSGTIRKRARTYHEGMVHELTWSKAINHLVEDRDYDYDVEFSLPDSPGSVGRPLTLSLEYWYVFDPHQVNVELYTVASGSETGIPGAIRQDSDLKLTVIAPPQRVARGTKAVVIPLAMRP